MIIFNWKMSNPWNLQEFPSITTSQQFPRPTHNSSVVSAATSPCHTFAGSHFASNLITFKRKLKWFPRIPESVLTMWHSTAPPARALFFHKTCCFDRRHENTSDFWPRQFHQLSIATQPTTTKAILLSNHILPTVFNDSPSLLLPSYLRHRSWGVCFARA